MAKHKIIKSHHRALQLVATARRDNFDAALKHNPSLAKAINVLFRYILNGTLKIKAHHIKKLIPYKSYIRKIAHRRRGQYVIQKGGSILHTILTIAVPWIEDML